MSEIPTEICTDTGDPIINTPDFKRQCPGCWLEGQPTDCIVELSYE